MTDADGWITHDGGPCPVDQETWVCVAGDNGAWPATAFHWPRVTAYRAFIPAHTPPRPSPFIAETAARIMAGMRKAAGMLQPDMFQNWHRCEAAKHIILAAAEEAGNG